MPLPRVGLDPAKLGGVLGTSTTPVQARVRVRCLISPRLLPPPTNADTLEYWEGEGAALWSEKRSGAVSYSATPLSHFSRWMRLLFDGRCTHGWGAATASKQLEVTCQQREWEQRELGRLCGLHPGGLGGNIVQNMSDKSEQDGLKLWPGTMSQTAKSLKASASSMSVAGIRVSGSKTWVSGL